MSTAPLATTTPRAETINLLCRALGEDPVRMYARVVDAGIESMLADREVSDVVERLRALDARVERPGSVVVKAAPEPASAGSTSQPARVDLAVEEAARRERTDPRHRRRDLGRACFKPKDPVPAPPPIENGEPLSAEERKAIGEQVRAARSAASVPISQAAAAAEMGMSKALLSIIERGAEGARDSSYRRAREWAARDHSRPTPDLYECPPLRARLTVAACERNKQLAKDPENPNRGGLDACLKCPGVVKLAEGRAA